MRCPYCHANNAEDTSFCSECGTYLLGDEQGTTGILTPSRSVLGDRQDDLERADGFENSLIRLRMHIAGSDRHLEFTVSSGRELLIGRNDAGSNIFPDVDLSSDDAHEKGVSRRHARIVERRGILVVEDLGSINGTSINTKRLPPYLPGKLSDGDQLQIGKIVFKVRIDRLPPGTGQLADQ